jgi:hypothetical protein
MQCAAGICEHAHDLAAVVVSKGYSQRGPWDIDLGEGQFIVRTRALPFGATPLGDQRPPMDSPRM